MGIDTMRVGGGRCPSVIVGGLVVVCIMMLCNWWTLSSTNLELLRQIDELNEQVKISVEERDQCITERGVFEKQLKKSQDDGRTTKVRLSQVDDGLSLCKKELESQKQLDFSRTTTIEALRVDKKTMTTQLEMKREQIKKLEDELEKVKDELEKVKLSVNAPPQKQTAILPIASILDKAQAAYNKTVNAPPVNVPPNAAVNDEPQGPDAHEKDASNMKDDTAAEVHDGNNAIESDLNFNLVSDMRARET